MSHRKFKDAAGREWDVWNVIPQSIERPAPAATSNHSDGQEEQREEGRMLLGPQWAGGWLTFETTDEKRRLAPYPDAWIDATAEELERLCQSAVLIKPAKH